MIHLYAVFKSPAYNSGLYFYHQWRLLFVTSPGGYSMWTRVAHVISVVYRINENKPQMQDTQTSADAHRSQVVISVHYLVERAYIFPDTSWVLITVVSNSEFDWNRSWSSNTNPRVLLLLFVLLHPISVYIFLPNKFQIPQQRPCIYGLLV